MMIFQRRSVELKPGVECIESGTKPDSERDCVLEESFLQRVRFSTQRNILQNFFFPLLMPKPFMEIVHGL